MAISLLYLGVLGQRSPVIACCSYYKLNRQTTILSHQLAARSVSSTRANQYPFSLHEAADALSHHPGMVAITSGGGIGILAGLYRSPAIWKLLARATSDNSILFLPQRPSHKLHTRKSEVQRLSGMFKLLRKQNGKNTVASVYLTGRPGFGKTQLAREYGKMYYYKHKGWIFKNLFVGTLVATNKASFLQSYIALAYELGLESELRALEYLSGRKGEMESLELLAATVRKELKKRPGWLLIIDNLCSDVLHSDETLLASSSTLPELMPVIPPSSLPSLSAPGISKDIPLSHGLQGMGVAASYGIGSQKAAWRSFWPQAGDDNWGNGYVLITTHDRRLVERSSPFASELFLQEGMSERDAVALLETVSGCHGEGAKEVVDALDRAPLSVASAGFYISAERKRNPTYSFHDYIEGLEKGIQIESEKMLLGQNVSHPLTMKMAISMAAEQLAADPHLHKVFLLMAMCAPSSVPMSLVARVLGVRPDINSAILESVRSCALLEFPRMSQEELDKSKQAPSSSMNDMEAVTVYRGTREVFSEVLLGENCINVEQRNEILCSIIDNLILEYESASHSDSVLSYHLRYMLLPHMLNHFEVAQNTSGFQLDARRDAGLCFALGSGYLLTGRPNKARWMLERALEKSEECYGKGSIQTADFAVLLGSTYRQLALRKESEFVLKEALGVYEKESNGVSIKVADALSSLSATYKHRGQYYESKKCLERALEIYNQLYPAKHPSIARALTNLGATMRSLGDSMKSKELFERALNIQEQLYESNHPTIAFTLGNLSVSYSDLGYPHKAIELLERALKINKQVHGPDHISVAITLSNLSVAHRNRGDVHSSEDCAKEALRLAEAVHGPSHPGVAVALGVLGSTYSDLGELSKAQKLLEKSVEINKTVNGSRHVGTAIAQTQLGRVTRLAGNLQEAKQLLETALETKSLVYEEDHPSIGMTLNSLGKVYHELGYLSQSLRAFHRSQLIAHKFYKSYPSHPQLAFGNADLAKVLRDTGDLESSAEMMQDAIDLYLKTANETGNPGFTKTHPKYASMLAIMGLLHRELGDIWGAKKSLETALSIQRQILSQQSLMKAETMCNLGTVLHQLGKRNKALENLNTALIIMKEVQYEHPITATISCALARVLIDTNDLHSAQWSLQEALEIRTKCCGKIHPSNALYHKLLSDIKLQLNDKEGSGEHVDSALEIYRSLYQREKELSYINGDVIISKLPILDSWNLRIQELEES